MRVGVIALAPKAGMLQQPFYNCRFVLESNVARKIANCQVRKFADPTIRDRQNIVVYSTSNSGYYGGMRTHQEIDNRSLAMARAIVQKIDSDLQRRGLDHAREVCRRWNLRRSSPAISEWLEILEKPWDEIRSILLDEGERGKRLQQSSHNYSLTLVEGSDSSTTSLGMMTEPGMPIW